MFDLHTKPPAMGATARALREIECLPSQHHYAKMCEWQRRSMTLKEDARSFNWWEVSEKRLCHEIAGWLALAAEKLRKNKWAVEQGEAFLRSKGIKP